MMMDIHATLSPRHAYDRARFPRGRPPGAAFCKDNRGLGAPGCMLLPLWSCLTQTSTGQDSLDMKVYRSPRGREPSASKSYPHCSMRGLHWLRQSAYQWIYYYADLHGTVMPEVDAEYESSICLAGTGKISLMGSASSTTPPTRLSKTTCSEQEQWRIK